MHLARSAGMQSNISRGLSFDDARRRNGATSRQLSSVVRTRTAVAGVLTLVVAAIAVAVGLAFGRVGLALYAIALPVPLFYLWMATDVVRADEREDER